MVAINRRAVKDFLEIRNNYERGEDKSIYIKATNSRFDHFKAVIDGPMWSPYETGRFVLDINLDNDYPKSPPKVFFITKVWHPNICSQYGHICLDILEDKWTRKLSLRTTILSIQALLSSPEPDDPLDPDVGRQYKSDYMVFMSTALFWTHFYATGTYKVHVYEKKVAYMVNMGLNQDDALYILSCCDWNMPQAVKEASSILKYSG